MESRHAVSPIHAIPNPPEPAAPPAPSGIVTQCDECSAPVAEEQRYCVVCGAHRRHVDDPAARYLSQVSARARTSKAAVTARRAPRGSSRARGIGLAVVLALIPVGAAVGVLADRSSNGEDTRLINELSRVQAADARAAAGGSASTTAGASTAATSTGTTGATHATKNAAKNAAGKAKTHRTGAKTTAAKSSSTKAAAPISTKPPTAAAKAAGSAATKKVQKSTGKSYVTGQSGLPTTVVVP